MLRGAASVCALFGLRKWQEKNVQRCGFGFLKMACCFCGDSYDAAHMPLEVNASTWEQAQAVVTKVSAQLPSALVILLVAFVLNLAIRRGIDSLARRTSPTFAEPSKRAVRLFITLAAVILIADAYGADLNGLWTMLSATLALVALGFVAVWSVLSNISCTLLILFFRPYEIGDEVEFIDPVAKGTVVSLNFGYTTLRDETGMLVQIPNNLFFQKIIKRRPGRYSRTSLVEQLQRSAEERQNKDEAA